METAVELLSEDHLVGWLVFARVNLRTRPLNIPTCVREALQRKGYIEIGEDDEDGVHNIRVTDAGHVVSDLAAPEWGVDPVP